MQYSGAHQGSGEANAQASASVVNNALQVLAATASNDVLRERYHDDQCSNSSQSSDNKSRDGGGGVNSEDDDAGSRNSSGSSSSDNNGVSKRTGLRKGKWTSEEEDYATRFIHYFSSGLLTLPEGKTLRASLAEKLRCDPMRITKKYAGASCLGNKISRLCDRPRFSPRDVEMARMEIVRLERRFQLRLSQGAGALLPPESKEPQMPFESSQSPSSMSAQTVHLDNTYIHQPSDMQLEMPNHGTSHLPQAGTAGSVPITPAVHPATISVNNGAPTAAAAPLVSSYLAKLASNAHLAAAASLNPNAAPLLVGAQHVPVPAPIPAVPQQSQPQHHPQQMAQAQLAALNLPMMFQGMNQAAAVSNTAASPATANNAQLVQTLLLQITTQLQALATLSPTTLRQIQLQILAATMASAPAMTAPQVPQQALLPGVGADAATMLASFQLAAAGQLQMGHHAMLQANSGLQNLLPVAQPVPQAPVALAPAPLLNPYAINNAHAFATNAVAGSPAGQPQSPAPQVQADQGSLRARKRSSPPANEANKAPASNKLPSASAPTPSKGFATAGNNMVDFLAKLRQGHAQAVEQARREQVENYRRVSNDAPANGESVGQRGPAAKKQKRNPRDDGVVALLPFEHATTVSSGSGCTTNEGSTSSSENLLASDEARTTNDGSFSSMSEEDDCAGTEVTIVRRGSVPLRKRFRSEKRGGGITRRNLADHNVRMAEEMKNHDGSCAHSIS